MFERVRELISKELGIEESKIKPESRLAEDLGADSLDAVELIMQLEEKFSVEIDDEAAMKIKTVADIVKYLEEIK